MELNETETGFSLFLVYLRKDLHQPTYIRIYLYVGNWNHNSAQKLQVDCYLPEMRSRKKCHLKETSLCLLAFSQIFYEVHNIQNGRSAFSVERNRSSSSQERKEKLYPAIASTSATTTTKKKK